MYFNWNKTTFLTTELNADREVTIATKTQYEV